MTILTEGHKMWPEYIQLQKCGSISLGLNFNLLGLNCFFCSTICTKLEEFKKHIQKQHTKELQELYEAFETKNVDEEIAIKIEPCLYLQDGACDIFEDELQEHNFDKEDEKEEDMSLKTEMPSTSKMSRGSKNVTTKVETINTLESDNEHREPDHEIFSSLNKNEYKSSNENASSDEDNSVSERNMDDDFLTESEVYFM